MKKIQISLRLSESEYKQVKRYAQKSHLSINQLLRDLIHGNLCFCQHQNILGPLNTNDLDDEKIIIASKTFELVYEILLLLRDFTAITNPKLIDLAIEKRLAYFEEAEEDE
jgi:hypothetical protein